MMKIEHFYYIKTVAECKSISLAAEKLYLSQQRLSEIISRIEDTLNISLFHRSNKGVTLTKAGEKALVKIETLLSVYEDLLQTGVPQETLLTSLKISNDKFINTCYFSDIIAIFNDYFPHIHLQIEEEMSPLSIINKIINQEIDLGMTTCSDYFLSQEPLIEQYRDKAFILRFLHEDNLFLIAHRELDIMQKSVLNIEDLLAFPLILNPDSFLLAYLQVVYAGKKPEVFLASNSAIAQLGALQEKKGVSFTTGFALQNVLLNDYHLAARPLEGARLKIVAFIPIDKAENKVINTFLNSLQNILKKSAKAIPLVIS